MSTYTYLLIAAAIPSVPAFLIHLLLSPKLAMRVSIVINCLLALAAAAISLISHLNYDPTTDTCSCFCPPAWLLAGIGLAGFLTMYLFGAFAGAIFRGPEKQSAGPTTKAA